MYNIYICVCGQYAFQFPVHFIDQQTGEERICRAKRETYANGIIIDSGNRYELNKQTLQNFTAMKYGFTA